ncbi:glucose/galactose MFS transporter [Flavihumibacter sp. UBA7668]|uniref:glucose/galactose MFS transporter n=1 Tax=Flavihumibacter sp. UBA7668 TaxID=1946542 RepID=UPI0025C55AF8|nr:glucose/galactose MFS transporter [Flavihumibacter sp. UBA7668]
MKQSTIISIAIIAGLFFIFGLVSWVNAILIPYFKIACELSNFQSYLVAFAFYISYFVLSVPASFLLKKLGFKKGMMVGFWIMAAGAFLFVPAALGRTYAIFLAGLFTLGAGLAILQTAANPYITVLGPKERAAQRISIMGICNKFAGILAPLLFAAAILRPTDADLFKQIPLMEMAERSKVLDELIRRVIGPYSIVGIALILLGILVRYSPLPEINTDEESEDLAVVNSSKTSVLQFPHLVLGAIAIFLHVGTQVIAIDTIIPYAGSMQIDLLEAKSFPGYTLTATIIGYVLGIIAIPKLITQVTALRTCTLLGLLFSGLIISAKGPVSLLGHQSDVSIWFLVLLGLANSLVWAGIWPLALDGLGRFTKVGASVMIMGLCGNAIMPLLYGWAADAWGLRMAYLVLIPCYLYLIFYAFYGHQIRNWKKTVVSIAVFSLTLPAMAQDMKSKPAYRLLTIDPGHFHAALVMKTSYPEIDTTCYVYAPDNQETTQYLQLIQSFNKRSINPTNWNPQLYAEREYLKQAWMQPPGSILVLAGKNRHKADHISSAVEQGYDVLADKPMAINPFGFQQLEKSLEQARKEGRIVLDIMTERFEIINILQRILLNQRELFGELEKGTPENPAVVKESLHHYYKMVAGQPLRRPEWQYDPSQAGSGLVDVTTHLIDLVQWTCFPEVELKYKEDIMIHSAREWNTALSFPQFAASTEAKKWPDYLAQYILDDTLHIPSNGEILYSVRGVVVKVKVEWNYKAADGGGDTHYSVVRGSGANLVIRQGSNDRNGASLYIQSPKGKDLPEDKLKRALELIQQTYPDIGLVKEGLEWKLLIPDQYRTGHEAHFAKVTSQFLQYKQHGNMPAWEWFFMLAKYYITTQSLLMAKSK